MHELSQQSADLVFAWCFPHSPNRSAHTRAGFVEFPVRMRPVELHVGARALAAGADRGLVVDPAAWYMSYLDSDTV